MQGQENNDFLMHFRPKRMVFIMERNDNSCSIPIARSTKNRLDSLESGQFSYVLVALLFFVHSNRRSLPCFFARSLDILAIMEYTKNS